jgi:hypothetical protein
MGTYYDRSQLHFTQPYEAIIDGFTELIRRQVPDATIKFTECEHCDQLHMLAFFDASRAEEPEIALSIDNAGWQVKS